MKSLREEFSYGQRDSEPSLAYQRGANLLDGRVPSFCKQNANSPRALRVQGFSTRSAPTTQKGTPRGAFAWRRQRDSNPRGVAPKRFSRPPRYDRFDMPPYCFPIVSHFRGNVNRFFERKNPLFLIRQLDNALLIWYNILISA